jgi:hypothetical protein
MSAVAALLNLWEMNHRSTAFSAVSFGKLIGRLLPFSLFNRAELDLHRVAAIIDSKEQ